MTYGLSTTLAVAMGLHELLPCYRQNIETESHPGWVATLETSRRTVPKKYLAHKDMLPCKGEKVLHLINVRKLAIAMFTV